MEEDDDPVLPSVTVLFDGYRKSPPNGQNPATYRSNCSCVLIQGDKNVIVDTMTPWDREKILSALESNDVDPDDIDYVVSTHAHIDHTGNNNLFLNATHIVGFTICKEDLFWAFDFDENVKYDICPHIEVVQTSGHTKEHVSVIVDSDQGVMAITGDLFTMESDIQYPSIWQNFGDTYNSRTQIESRLFIADRVSFIIPGHGPMFAVTAQHKEWLKKQLHDGSLNEEANEDEDEEAEEEDNDDDDDEEEEEEEVDVESEDK